MKRNVKGARHSSPTSSRSKTRQNAILILVCSLIIVAAMFRVWGQTIQHEHAESVHAEVIANA